LYERSGRKPSASINFIISHDGFTLRDLVSYNEKNNEANGEKGRDGDPHNLSWNCGVEGPTDNPEILSLRERQMRNLLVTLLVSQGVPMLRAGDELQHTQQGNNNAYCQDNELSWLNWDLDPGQREFLDFVRRTVRFRLHQPALQRRKFFQGRQIYHGGCSDLTWLTPSGLEMKISDWQGTHGGVLAIRLNGKMIDEIDDRGRAIESETLLILFNGEDRQVEFTLPQIESHEYWKMEIDTASLGMPSKRLPGGIPLSRIAHSMAVLVLKRFRPKLLSRFLMQKWLDAGAR
jgi:glycogen operon protein